MATLDEARKLVYSLPLADQMTLVRELSDRLEEAGVEFDLHPEWIDEIVRRSEAYERDELKARPWRESVEIDPEIVRRIEAYDEGKVEAVGLDESLQQIQAAIKQSRASTNS